MIKLQKKPPVPQESHKDHSSKNETGFFSSHKQSFIIIKYSIFCIPQIFIFASIHIRFIMTGTWKGYYKYNSEWAEEATGFEKTGFTITIDSFDGTTFQGTVNDDTATGGMEGTGKIMGSLNGAIISFRKFMPEGSLLDADGKHIYTGKKHDTLYYSGKLLKEGQFVGRWKFRVKITLFFGFVPMPYSPGSGTWYMTKQ